MIYLQHWILAIYKEKPINIVDNVVYLKSNPIIYYCIEDSKKSINTIFFDNFQKIR